MKTQMETKEINPEEEPRIEEHFPIEEQKESPQFVYAKDQFDEAWESQKDKGKVGKKSAFGTNNWIFDRLFLKKL
jgi:hypothetical protein